MSQSIEWAHAHAGLQLITGQQDAGDGNTPDSGEVEEGNIALVIDGCALYGQPADLLELLSDGISQISAHLAGQQN